MIMMRASFSDRTRVVVGEDVPPYVPATVTIDALVDSLTRRVSDFTGSHKIDRNNF